MNSFVQATPLRCIGCRTCLISCVVAHEGKRIFEIDPDSYNFNPRLFMVKTARVSAPVQCRHCENPACKASCASGAIFVKDDVVIIDAKKCIGCKNCVIACPFGAVELVETGEILADGSPRRIANKCDLCAGVADSPSCVKVCPTAALTLVTAESLGDSVTDKRRNAVAATVA
ncbi:MAG: 4Fe-4S dicluster domain-containing protein [Treponema sp.]|jgi:electron transport protein HydN|nr:4Fe-4S dicluster domain-containing protein [Treponema sp.]